MAIKVKPHGPRFKKFEIWTKMAKVPKPQGPKWQFTPFNKCVYVIHTLTDWASFTNFYNYKRMKPQIL
ncbi:hypothetical protein Hanom_Chr14g01289631 [Helianthus anomalus]